jgi:protein gp37
MALRLQAMGQRNYARGFRVTLHHHMLNAPVSWRKPRTVFVNSMSDLFHESVPWSFICQVFDVMRRAHWHQYQLLTKRSARLAELSPCLAWPPNVWAGVTVENADYVSRIDDLRQAGAAVRFVSFEPLLGPVPHLDLRGIHWVIVGGESGPGARPMREAWLRSLRDQAVEAGVPFFFKQWGGARRTAAGRLLEGRTWDEMPCAAPAVTGDSWPQEQR